jgi:putative spermidine/putrescine transport system permease protein
LAALRPWRLLAAILPGGLLLAFVAGLAGLLASSLAGSGAEYAAFFARPDYVRLLLRTWWLAAATSVLCLLLGYPTALFIARTRLRRDLLLLVVVLPWLVSIVVRTYGWIVLLGNRGVLNGALVGMGLTDRPVRLMFNTGGVIVGLVHVFCPFAVMTVLSALLQQDRTLEDAGTSLGAGPWTTFRRIVLPLSVPGVMSGLTLVYLMSTGAIVTPLLLGGIGDQMLGSQIYTEVFQQFDFPKAAVMAVLLGGSSLLVILPLRWLERRLTANMPQVGNMPQAGR